MEGRPEDSSGERFFRFTQQPEGSNDRSIGRARVVKRSSGSRRSHRGWNDRLPSDQTTTLDKTARDSPGVIDFDPVICGCRSYGDRGCASEFESPLPVSVKRSREMAFSFLPRMAAFFVFACLLLQDGRPTYAMFTTVITITEPEFVDEIGNVTVPAGRNIKLACSVKNLGQYKVAWMLYENGGAILTVQNHVITRNPRISVSHDKHRTWYLHIKEVQQDDEGKYMCQINTATAKTHYGYLYVVVPPNIVDYQTSSDVVVQEGVNVSLSCKASGSPKPQISWKKEDGSKITINKTLSVMEWKGESLEITRISRLDMGVYLCIASNGVPPTVSKQIKVSVDFIPMLWIPHQLVGAPLGYAVTLECFTEAHPISLNYWTREDGVMIQNAAKYRVTTTPEKPFYKTHMTLTIYNINESDYGSYKCNANNSRGGTDGTIRLYKSPPPSTSPSPSTTELPKKDWEHTAEINNSVYGNPSSLTIHNEKGTKSGNKFESNLNEIGKSEQKSSDPDRGRNYNWPPDNDSSAARTATGVTLAIALIAVWIIR
ncbi:lachesin [Lasioglossum baleicum]|uniref:lachesin n=1 Tax=Lasioglossum baleicum TaxID=434251 RepID=UPI003FCD622E